MLKKRDNGLDLLRIICMLLVTFSHVFTHGGLVANQLPGTFPWFLGNPCSAAISSVPPGSS